MNKIIEIESEIRNLLLCNNSLRAINGFLQQRV